MRRQVAVLAFYALLACLSLYMPILHLGTHLPGAPAARVTDFYHFHWNYWWIRHALTTPGLNVYETNYVMAPYTSSLAYHTLTPFWFPIWAAVEPLFDTVVAMTAIFVVAMALAGGAFYALLRREGVWPGLALVGGTMLMLSPVMFTGVFWTNVNLMGWFWIPALVLIWGQVARAPRVWPVILGVALWGMILVDLQYAVLAAFILVPYAGLTLWQAESHAARARLVGWGLLAIAIALGLLWIAGPLPYLLEYDRSTLTGTPADAAISIPFPQGYMEHLREQEMPISLGAILLPLLALALMLSILARRKGIALPTWRWFWLALVPAPLVLSAGASVVVAGARIPLPYGVLHDALGGMFRYPERFAPVILIPAVLFIMQTLGPLLAGSRWCGASAALLLVIVIGDARALSPFPIQPGPPRYELYETMGREPYDYVVVEVPTGASSGEGLVGEPIYATLQFYGITHGKRMINGHLSRVDPTHFWYLRTDDPLLSWLGQRRLLESEKAAARLRQIIYDYPVGYVVVHTDLILRYTGHSTVEEVLGYLNRLPDLVCPAFVEGPVVAYRTVWHPDGCPPRTPPQMAPGTYQIDVGSSGDQPYLGWGWHWQEEIVPGLTARWTGLLPQADVFAELPPGEYSITLAVQSYLSSRTLRLRANGVPLCDVAVGAASLETVTCSIPAELTADGAFLTLTLGYDVAGPVADRALALLVDWVRFTRQ